MIKNHCIATFLIFASCAFAQENYANWSFHKDITLNTAKAGKGANVSTPVTNFPVLVRLTSANSDVFSKAGFDGADIRFTAANGKTRLMHQRERWDDKGRAAEFWVLVPGVAGNASTTFRMYWGRTGAEDSSNGAAVFATSNNFAAVFHMSEAAGDTLRDATENGFKGIPQNAGGNNPADVTGAVGMAKDFLGNNSDGNGGAYRILTAEGGDTHAHNALSFRNDSTTALGQSVYTISAWIQVDAFPDGTKNRKAIIAKSAGVSGKQYHLRLMEPSPNQIDATQDTNRIEFNDGIPATYKNGSPNLALTTWYHVAAVRSGPRGDAMSLRMWVNGYALPAGTGISSNSITNTQRSNYDVFIGGFSGNTGFFSGLIDEVEFANVGRSPGWLKLSYETQKPGATCLTLGATQGKSKRAP